MIGSFKLFILQYHCVRDSKGEAYSSQWKFPNCWSCELYCKVRVIKLQYLLCSDQLVLISTKHLTAAVCLGGKKCNIIIWCNLQAQIRNLDELGIFLIKGQECRKEVVLLSLMLALCTLWSSVSCTLLPEHFPHYHVKTNDRLSLCFIKTNL